MQSSATPLISVIVPTFNRAYCVARTVDSALAQSYGHIEVIIIDDGSIDGTREMVAARYEAEPRVKYQYQENAGVAAARNHGFSLAQGEYVALLDSDDVWLPWKLELQMACMRQCPEIGMMWTDMEAVDAQGQVTNRAFLRTMYHAWRQVTPESLFGASTILSDLVKSAGGRLGEEIAVGHIASDAHFYAGNIFSPMILGNLVHTSTVLIRRDRLAKVKGFDVELKTTGEDYDFHLRTCREGPVGFLDLATIRYQTGMPDRLTQPAYRLDGALNTLNTIAPLIKARRGITLPARILQKRLADAHDRVAYIMFDQGNFAGCRKHSIESLRQYPWRVWGWALLFCSCFPATWVAGARRIRRQWKHPRRAGADSL